MVMPIKTKRWNDRKESDDGWRVLICRYRPRALPKKDETWDKWYSQLGPSRELHADFYGKHGPPITWDEYRRRYLAEMQGTEQQELIAGMADLVAEGKTLTLLCSSACEDASHCHRTLLRELVEAQIAKLAESTPP
ncbi:MAG TPA: DUF488 family protein [Gemmataceae bacterium]|nr:DUF488 family protein [Gemmataceae bacterium]